MLNEIYEYGLNNKNIPKSIEYSELKFVRCFIHIDEFGHYEDVEVVNSKEVKRVTIPKMGIFVKAANRTMPFVNSVERVIPNWVDSNFKHKVWIKYMNLAFENVEGLDPIKVFINKLENSNELQNNIKTKLLDYKVKNTDLISFKINGEYYLDINDKWKIFIKKLVEDYEQSKNGDRVNKYISTITGKEFEGLYTETFCGGMFISSFPQESFQHYGFEGDENKHISPFETVVINNALFYLLSSPEHHNNKFNLIYWNEKDDVPNILYSSLLDDEDDYFSEKNIKEIEAMNVLNDLFAAAEGGIKPNKKYDSKYHIFVLKKTGDGRCLISNSKIISYDELSNGLFDWYKDSSLVGKDLNNECSVKQIKNINKILKILNVSSEKLKSSLLESFYNNKQLPRSFITKVLHEIEKRFVWSKNKCKKEKIKYEERIPIELYQLIKIYLIRGGLNVKRKLDKDCDSTCYQLGRCFSVIEKLQRDTSDSTTMETHFKGMKTKTKRTYSRILDLGKIYIRRLDFKYQVSRKRELDEICSKIIDIPDKMTDQQKCEFELGYFQQSIENYKKKNKAEEIISE